MKNLCRSKGFGWPVGAKEANFSSQQQRGPGLGFTPFKLLFRDTENKWAAMISLSLNLVLPLLNGLMYSITAMQA